MEGKKPFPGIGIRGKLLLFLGAAVFFIVALEIAAQVVNYRLTREYESYMDYYHLVHRARISLGSLRSEADRYIRDPAAVPVESLYESISTLALLNSSIAPLEDWSVHAGFEVRATGYGLDACFPLMNRSVSGRAAGNDDYYADYAKADRIAGYVDSYLSNLLGILMKDGEARFRKESARSAIINRAILVSMISAALLAMIYVYLVANSITSPIRQLARESERLARGDLDAEPVKVKSRDEIQVLADSFFTMSTNIRFYIEGLTEKTELERRLHEEEMALLGMGKALREAQFKNLQEQMRPHFLFNALNSIARTALMENAPSTEKLTISLARLLRATMREGGPYIPLSEEMGVVREYLAFQKARFGERLEWEIKYDPAIAGIEVPRFLLQPLVENAVRHGIEPLEQGGGILVSMMKKGGGIKAYVVDTGAGMEPGRLAEIRRGVARASGGAAAAERESAKRADRAAGPEGSGESASLISGVGVGLGNLATRLFILYGKQAGIAIHSKRGKGTIVRIRLPSKEPVKWPES